MLEWARVDAVSGSAERNAEQGGRRSGGGVDAVRWASTISEAPTLAAAARETIGQVREQLAGEEPDLLVVFVSDAHREAYSELSPRLSEEFPGARLIGCSARSVIAREGHAKRSTLTRGSCSTMSWPTRPGPARD